MRIRSMNRIGHAVALATLGAASAHAQQSATSGTLEEITITARKFAENLQDTPIAVSAFSGDALIERQVFNTNELDQVVPNLQFANNAPLAGNNSSSQVFIRGIGQTDPTSTVDPGVGLYIDGVYIGTAVGGSMGLRDFADIQVLRGPQGTLFGRNTIGGAVLIQTTDPGDDFGGTARATVGSDSLIDAFGAVDVPLAATLKSRFSFGLRKQDGYVTRSDGRDLGDTDTFTVTGKLIWQPLERLTTRLLVDYSESDENGSPLVFAAINESATFPRVASLDAGCPGLSDGAVPPPGLPDQPAVPMIADDRCANDVQARGPYRNNGTYPLESTLENWGTSLNVALGIGESNEVKSISSYREINWTGNRDADNTPLTILHTAYDVESSQWSEELQFTHQSDSLRGVVGLYYFAQKSDDVADVFLNPPPPGVQRDSDNNRVDNDSWAAFSQWTYNVTERLALTAGGRYTEETKRSFPDQFDYSSPAIKQVPMRWYEATFDAFTANASIAFEWTSNVMTYFSYAEGFKGGGWNSHFNAVLTPEQQAALHAFKPEEADTFELGFKLDLLGRTLRVNGAIFTGDYTDMQVTYRGPAPAGVAPFLTNAGQASIDGAELEVTWAPTLDLTVDASIGYLDATIDELDNIPLAVLPPGLREGNVLPFAPEWQAHVGVSYDIHAGDFAITPRIDASYKDATFFDATNSVEIAQLDDVTTVNASLMLKPTNGPWRVSLNVNNVTDETYPIAGNSSFTTGSGYAEIAYSRPREYFVMGSFDF